MCGLLWTAENVVSSWAKEGFDDLGQISGANTFEAGESPPRCGLLWMAGPAATSARAGGE